MIKLYGSLESRAVRSLWLLEELELEYENPQVHFPAGTQEPDYLAINPNGRIPVLDDNGLILFESMAINLHLAKKYDGGLWPKGDDDQSRAIQWSIWAMTELEPPVMQVVTHRALLPESERDPTVGDAGELALRRPLAVLEGALDGGDTLLGGGFSVADLNVLSVLFPALSVGRCHFQSTPHVAAWLGRCPERPAARRTYGLA